jgi:hypothetical protein
MGQGAEALAYCWQERPHECMSFCLVDAYEGWTCASWKNFHYKLLGSQHNVCNEQTAVCELETWTCSPGTGKASQEAV